MTTFLLVRHGESQANLEGRFAGHWDIPLTERGKLQARCTGEFLAKNYTVDSIYSSDLCRAMQTAQPVAERLELEIQKLPALREIDAGAWEGQLFTHLQETYSDDYSLWRQDIGNSRCTEGESVEALSRRIYEALQQIAFENPDKTVMIATHATPIRAMQWRLGGQPLGYMKQIPWATNASVTEVFFEKGAFSLGRVSYDAHLADMISQLPINV